jgi:hypothetical protein
MNRQTQAPARARTGSTRSRAAKGPRAGDPLAPLNPEAWTRAHARHLLWRAGFGGTPEQVALLAGWGLEKSVASLMDYATVPFAAPTGSEFDSGIMGPPTAEQRMEYRQAAARRDEDLLARLRLNRQQAEQRDRQQMREVQRWWLTRMIETPRPLEEKLTLFWHGHFATSYRTIEDSWHMFLQNQLFRVHAAGNFGELLFGIIRDPAMLAYLDNNDSRKDRPNENLAREIMELFALGVGNYTEEDIKNGARALTGYSFEDDEFIFRGNNHDRTLKTIFGRTEAFDGDGFVRMILEHPACATFIATKLYDAFVRSVPLEPENQAEDDRRVIGAMSSELQRARSEVGPVLRKVFGSAWFYDDAVMLERVKSPVELVVGAVRSLNAPVRDLDVLNDALELMGQELFFPPSVKGWPGGRSWINTATLFTRQNILAYLLTGARPNRGAAGGGGGRGGFDAGALVRSLGFESGSTASPEPGLVVARLTGFLLGRDTPAARRTLEEFVASVRASGGGSPEELVTGAALLITSMPEYQLC